MIIDSPIVSGSYAGTGSFNQAGNVIVSGSLTVTGSIIGNLTGTASYATTSSYALTASYAANVPETSSYAISASYAINATSASYAANSNSASYSVTASYSFNSTTASYAQTASYANNIIISGSIANVDYIDFDLTASFASALGRLGYDSGEGTLQFGMAGGNVTLNIGSDLYQYVYNNTTSSMSKGQVVYVSGSQGNRIAVKLASATAEQGSANTLGFVAETITAGGQGWVMTEGNLRKLDTSTLIGGKLIFLSTTPGAYTQTPPVAPNHGVRLGYAERIDNTVGSIYVKIDNGYEIGELHDVVDSTTSASFGDLLVKSGSVWINSKQLTGSYGVTGSITATSIDATSLTASNALITNNLAVNGTASFNYVQTVTGSAVIIGQEYIILNTQIPASRYAGIKVYDSGSNATASIVWDSQTNHWVYENQSGSSYSGGGFLAGPKNTGSLGDIAYPTQYRILRSQGDDHVYDSNIIDNDTAVKIGINAEVTGGLIVTNGITGSLSGTATNATTASYAVTATNAATASYVLNAVSASYASQSSVSARTSTVSVSGINTNANYVFPLIQTGSGPSFGLNTGTTVGFTYNPSSSLFTINNLRATGSLLGTASFADNASTASFVANAQTASYVQNAQSASYWSGSITNAESASYALTASYSANVPVTSSYANNAASASYALTSSYSLAGGGFPYSGSAEITGSLLITNLEGTGSRYLVTDASGNITAQSASAAIKTTQAFTATAGQTTFAVTNGYSTGYVDVFINGSKLNATEFTDTSGTNIVLATGSFANDIVEVVKYLPASGVSNNVLRQQTTFTASAGQTVFSASYTPGLLDIFYNGAKLSPDDFTANNGTYFTLATASAANDIIDVFVYSYQVGAFSGIGGVGTASQIAYFNTSNSITGSPNFTISGSTMTVTGSLLVSGSGTFTNIGPAVFSGSITSTAGFTGSFSGTATNATSASYALNATSASYALNTTTASFATQASTASSADAFTVRNTLTAQTLVVQTITSSVVYSSGSNIFGNALTNTQVFSGSIYMNPGGLFVSSSGLIGIGTTSPSSQLHINSGGSYTNTDPNNRIIVERNNHAYIAFSSPNEYDQGLHFHNTTDNALVGRIAYFHRATGDNLNFTVDSSIRMTINSSGSVGIGTTSPKEALEISGLNGNIRLYGRSGIAQNTVSNNIYYNGSIWTRDNLSYGAQVLRMDVTNNKFFIDADGTTSGYPTTRLTIDGSNGNVGIGTTNPSTKLDIAGDLTVGTGETSNTDILIKNATNAKTHYIFSDSTSGELGIESGASVGIKFNTNTSNTRMVITSGGNVGIGTSSPVSVFQVVGAGQGVGGFSGATYGIRIDAGGQFSTGMSTIHGVDTSLYGSYQPIMINGSDVRFGTSATERMRIKSTGEVGIGVTPITIDSTWKSAQVGNLTLMGPAPSSDKNGIIGANAYYNGGWTRIIAGYANYVELNQGSGDVRWYTSVSSTAGSAISSNAGPILLNGGTNWTAGSSDVRKKKNFETTQGLAEVLQIEPIKYHFDWEEDIKPKRLGFKAQNLLPLIPEMVVETGEIAEDGSSYLTITPDYMLPVLVKAIQEQQAQIQSLQAEINELKNK